MTMGHQKRVKQARRNQRFVIVPTKQLPPGMIALSPDQLSQLMDSAFDRGARSAIDALQEVNEAIHEVALRSSLLVMATQCNNGPDTRKAMKTALAEFAKSMQALETAISAPETDRSIVVDWSDIQPAITYWGTMRVQVAAFLRTKDDAALNRL